MSAQVVGVHADARGGPRSDDGGHRWRLPRSLLVGIAVEVGMIALVTSTPGLASIFHMSSLDLWDWAFLVLWPPRSWSASRRRARPIFGVGSRERLRKTPHRASETDRMAPQPPPARLVARR